MNYSPSLAVRIFSYSALIAFALFSIYPMLQVFTVSIRPNDQLLSTSLALIPEGATLTSYFRLITETDFFLWLRNSAIIAFAVTVLGTSLASTAGYALSRYKFAGRKSFLSGILMTQMFPATMLLLPLYLILIKLGLIDSYIGILVVYTATALPFCIWQMKGYYDSIPTALEEAASIDGCTPWQSFTRVIMPLALPGLVISGLFSFMASWNEYVVAALILQDKKLFTLPMGLRSFQGNMSTEWGLYAAGALLVSVPVVFLFLYLSRFLISGLTSGSVKG